MGQHARTRVTVCLSVFALSLLVLLCCSMLPVARFQIKPGPPSAPPATVSVIEVSPKALSLYTEYTGTTDALLPQPDPVFDDATAFDPPVDMLNAIGNSAGPGGPVAVPGQVPGYVVAWLKLREDHAGEIQELCGAGLQIGKP